MAKLSLVANPTFTAKVAIPKAGGDPVELEFTFKHRTKSGLAEFMTSRDDKTDTESFMDMVVGWELADEFNAESVDTLLENYIGTALATYHVYIDELVQAKLKN